MYHSFHPKMSSINTAQISFRTLIMTESKLDSNVVNTNFSRAAVSYDDACALQNKVLQRLLKLLEKSAIGANPHRLLDLGCGTGSAIGKLARRYPEAQIIGADRSWDMIQKAREHTIKKSNTNLIVADTFGL